MNFKEKYNYIIERIEYLIESGNENIIFALVQDLAVNERLLGDAFQFITDMTLSQYVRQRKLLHAIIYKIEMECSIDEAAEKFGFSDGAAFSKSFKLNFAKSPSAFTQADFVQWPPLYIEKILEDRNDSNSSQKENEKMFGLPETQFMSLKRMFEINTLYGFSDSDAELAYNLHEKMELPMHAAFAFVEDLLLQREAGADFGEYDLLQVATLSYQYDLSISQAKEVLYELEQFGIDYISDLPEGFFDIYFSEENDRNGYSVDFILAILKELERTNLTTDDFPQVAQNADLYYGGDLSQAMEKFEEDEMDFDLGYTDFDRKMDEEIGLFGFYSIWDVPEPEY